MQRDYEILGVPQNISEESKEEQKYATSKLQEISVAYGNIQKKKKFLKKNMTSLLRYSR